MLENQVDTTGQPLNDHLRAHVISLAQKTNGVPSSVVMYDAREVFSRVRVVQNIVQPDPNAPTLSEVRAMMDELEESDDTL